MKRSLFKKGLVLTAAAAVIMTGNIFAQDLSSALLLTKSEQYDKAEAMFNQLIQKEPANSKYYFYLGENKLLDYYSDTISNSLAQFTKEAKDVFQKGVAANANDPLNYVGLAKVATYLGDNATAAQMRTKAKSFLLPYKNLKKIVPPAKDYAFALTKIAESYIDEREVDTAAALPLIRQALKIDGKNPEIYLILGDIFNLINDGTSAIKQFNFAQYLDPKSPTACMKIGNIYTRGKSLNAAREKYEEAISLDPNYAPAYRELGQVYYMSNRYEQSKANFAKYLELSAGNIPAMTRYVNSLFYAGDYDEVIKVVEEILAVDDSKAYMNRLAGYSYTDRKNPDYTKALHYMDKLFETVSVDRISMKDHHYTARIIMMKNQDLPKMVDELENLDQQLQRNKTRYNSAPAAEKTKLKPALDELTAKYDKMKADVSASQKEVERGFKEYAKVIELKPQDASLKSEVAARYYAFKRYEDAAKTWGQLIDPAKNDINAYMRIGRAYNNGNNLKAADSIFNIVIKKNPEYLDAYVWDARMLARVADTLASLARIEPEVVVADLHPGYLSRGWAAHRAAEAGIPLRLVQHHHAHLASLLAEHGCRRASPSWASPSTAPGTARTARSGAAKSLLLGSYASADRVGHLAQVALPGGDAATRRPARSALAHLHAAGLPWHDLLPAVAAADDTERRVVGRMLDRGAGCTPTTSMGRLFDAVAALAGVCQDATYEGQAAIELEALSAAASATSGAWRYDILDEDGALVLDPAPVLRAAVSAVLGGAPAGAVGASFHEATAEAVASAALLVRERTGVATVGLTGGVFQNSVLTRACRSRLEDHGLAGARAPGGAAQRRGSATRAGRGGRRRRRELARRPLAGSRTRRRAVGGRRPGHGQGRLRRHPQGGLPRLRAGAAGRRDWTIVHVGFALTRPDEAAAQESLSLMRRWDGWKWKRILPGCWPRRPRHPQVTLKDRREISRRVPRSSWRAGCSTRSRAPPRGRGPSWRCAAARPTPSSATASTSCCPPAIELIHGPGCPVCVTPLETIDRRWPSPRGPRSSSARSATCCACPASDDGPLPGARARAATCDRLLAARRRGDRPAESRTERSSSSPSASRRPRRPTRWPC